MRQLPRSLKNLDVKKCYAHFDLRVSLRQCLQQVGDPSFVSRYSFYPLIQRDQRRIKHRGGECENDPRPICYAAHRDRCIFQFYSALLNDRYNEVAIARGIDDVSIAYRTNHPGMSNCEYAQRAFEKIRQYKECYICTGDFRKFFETLDHRQLKQRMRLLFDGARIPDDYYRVFKAATRYSVCDIRGLLDYHGLPFSKTGVKRLNQKRRVLEPTELRQLSAQLVSSPWKENGCQGIPQGLPVSGVLANVYMIDFDAGMVEAAREFDALYMRYSDDFILVTPNADAFRKMLDTLKMQVDKLPTLTMHPDKTCYFAYSRDCVEQLNLDLSNNAGARPKRMISYLGFTFDGKVVRLRQSTIGRFYRKTYVKTKNAFKCGQPGKKRVDRLYLETSDWGRFPNRNRAARKRCGCNGRHGNFHSYAHRAARTFPDDPILGDTRRHKRKIRNRSRRIRNCW